MVWGFCGVGVWLLEGRVIVGFRVGISSSLGLGMVMW